MLKKDHSVSDSDMTEWIDTINILWMIHPNE